MRASTTHMSDENDGERMSTDTDASATQQAIRRQAERIKARELQQAYNRLEADRSVSATEQAILDAMATAIVDEIVAAPVAVLDRADAYDDDTVETALELFDPNEG